MEEITKQCPCVYNLVDKNGWTILHVAAQCGESKVVKYILEVRGWESLINEIDNEGNTALHLAAIYGHYDSVLILARDGRVDKRATNKKYLKAIDIVQTNMDLGEIKRYSRATDRWSKHRPKINDNEGLKEGINELELREDRERISLDASESLRDRNNEVVKKKEITSKYLKDVSNTHLLVATLIATVTFAACFSLPGGYNQDEPNKGKSVFSTKVAFKAFVITDGIAFYCSTAAVFLHFLLHWNKATICADHLLQAFCGATDSSPTSTTSIPHSLQSIPCQATSQKRNALHIAANFKCIGFAEALVEKFPELLTRADFKGDTPLHIASRTGCSDMVKCFLESKNAKQALEMKNERADTALHVAVRNGHLEVVNRLVQENPKLLDLVNNHKESPLYLAVERGFFKIADELLKGNSSECSCEGTKGMTALHAAVIRTHKGPELGKPIPPELSVNGLGLHLRGEWFPGTQSNVGQEFPELSLEKLRRVVTNFFFRVRGHFKGKQLNDEIDIMEVLFEMKKDVIKKADEFGWTLFTMLPTWYDKSVAGLLDVEHSCALHIAAKEGHTNVMEQIITCLPDVYDLIDNKGRTILHVAAQYGNARVVKYILKKPNLESIINEPDKEDDRVDKRAMNNEYLKTIDIVQSNMDIGEIIKYWIMRKLEHAGGRQSLHRLVIRDNGYMQNGDNENANMRTDNNGHQKSSDGIDRSASDTSTQSSDGASRTASNMSILLDRNREIMKEKELRSHRLKDISNTHLLVATLIATVTFAAGFTLPGGYNDDGPDKGKAVLLTKIAFKAFLLSDGIAFYCSTAAVFLHFFASLERNYHLLLRFIKFSAILTYVSILGMVIAFTSGIYLVLPHSSELSTSAFVLGCLFLSFYIFGVL
ncbi:hypothetical protein AAG906_031141 [Vitis piasezkii]